MRSDEVLGRVFIFIPVVVVVQSLPLSDVSACDQKNSAFTIDIKPHTFYILFLLPTPASKDISTSAEFTLCVLIV